MADQNLLDKSSTNTSNGDDEIHIVRHNKDYRMDVSLIQSGVAADLTTGNAILEGGVIKLPGANLDYYVWASKFIINSVVYVDLVTDTVTLNDGDGSNDRFDVFTINVTDSDTPQGIFSVGVIEGTPSGTPLFPSLDLVTQVQVGFKLVPTSATTDASTTVNQIYDENTEWTNTTLTTGGTLIENTDPYAGSLNFKTPETKTDSVSWTDSGLTTFNSSDSLTFALRTVFRNNTKIQIKLINSSTSAYYLKTLTAGDFKNFALEFDDTGWQVTQINLSAFAPSSGSLTQYDRIEFTFINILGLELDRIEIQGELNQSDDGIRQRDLTDTPDSYIGKAGQIQKLNTSEDGWEFVVLPSGSAKSIIETTGTSAYTLVLSDANNIIMLNNSMTGDLIIPTNSSVAFPIGTVIKIISRAVSGGIDISGSGVTIRTSIGTGFSQFDVRHITKMFTDTWSIGF